MIKKVTLAYLASIGHTTSFFLAESKLTLNVTSYSLSKVTATINHAPYLLDVVIVATFAGIEVGVSVNPSCGLGDESYGGRNLRAIKDEVLSKMTTNSHVAGM